jgi:hypothetical protein
MAEEALVQGVCVLASSGQPDGDGGLSKTEDPFSGGRVQPFGKGRQDHRDLVRGSFQTVQGGAAPGSERAAASLAAKGLDPFDLAMLAIPNQRVDASISDAEVRTLLIGTGEAFGVNALGCSSPAFHLTPGAYWRRGRSHTWGAEATEGTIQRGAWPEETVDHRASAPCW